MSCFYDKQVLPRVSYSAVRPVVAVEEVDPCEGNRPPGATTRQFVRCRCVVGREHDPHRRQPCLSSTRWALLTLGVVQTMIETNTC